MSDLLSLLIIISFVFVCLRFRPNIYPAFTILKKHINTEMRGLSDGLQYDIICHTHTHTHTTNASRILMRQKCFYNFGRYHPCKKVLWIKASNLNKSMFPLKKTWISSNILSKVMAFVTIIIVFYQKVKFGVGVPLLEKQASCYNN